MQGCVPHPPLSWSGTINRPCDNRISRWIPHVRFTRPPRKHPLVALCSHAKHKKIGVRPSLLLWCGVKAAFTPSSRSCTKRDTGNGPGRPTPLTGKLKAPLSHTKPCVDSIDCLLSSCNGLTCLLSRSSSSRHIANARPRKTFGTTSSSGNCPAAGHKTPHVIPARPSLRDSCQD